MDENGVVCYELSQIADQLPLLHKHYNNTPILKAILRNANELDRMLLEGKGKDGRKFTDSNKNLLPVIQKNLSCLRKQCERWLNTGHYSAIPDRIRLIFAFICTVQAKLEFLRGSFLGDFETALRHCDQGLLMGNDMEDGSLSKFASLLCSTYLPSLPRINEQFQADQKCPPLLPNSVQIPSLELPSLETFYARFYQPNLPLIIRGMVNGWPAFEKWSFSHLNSIFGHRLVPVELGNKYTDEDWRQELMSFNQYLTKYVFPDSEPEQPGYLAQHRLIDQVPELLVDIPLPDYCAFGEQQSSTSHEEVTINVFIGPTGTVSPLHTDPRNNMFCQVRGRKFVRLVSPEHREGLYLYDDLMRKNTSQVDVEQPDLQQFPAFANVQCHDFVLEAGQCLFIPRGWFHHIRALEASISISIWFGPGAKME